MVRWEWINKLNYGLTGGMWHCGSRAGTRATVFSVFTRIWKSAYYFENKKHKRIYFISGSSCIPVHWRQFNLGNLGWKEMLLQYEILWSYKHRSDKMNRITVAVMLLIFMFIGFIQLTQSTQMQAIKQQNELLKVEITELQRKQRIQQQDIDLIEKILIQQAKP